MINYKHKELIPLSLSFSQEIWYNYPELEWKTFETDNFIICFLQYMERIYTINFGPYDMDRINNNYTNFL